MENEVFERDYSQNTTDKMTAMELKETNLFDSIAKSGVFKNYSDALKLMPKCIVPENKEAYEDLLTRIDDYARRKHGKIKGIVDYTEGISNIYIELPFFEVSQPEELALLSDMAKKSDCVTFEPSKSGGITIKVRIKYFAVIGDKDKLLSELIMKDPELVEMILEFHDERMKNIYLEEEDDTIL